MADEPPVPPIPEVKTSTLAIWSLVLGCLGLVLLLVCIGPLFSIPAVICGHMAHSRIKRAGGSLSGQGLALGGLITGYVSIALAVVLIPLMVAFAVPNFVKVRQTAQQSLCINNLRIIDGAKQSWALEKQKTGEDIPTADDLAPYLGKGFASLRCPLGGSYSINKVSEPPTCSNPTHRLPTAEGTRSQPATH
jgi:hypothetical protein